jgi:hypothetical protein
VGTSISKIALIAALTGTIWPYAASSQGVTGAGGLQVDLGVKSSLKADDNFKLSTGGGGTSVFSDTALTFGISSLSQTQTLALTGGATLRFGSIPGRSLAGLEDPNVRLNYTLVSANSRLAFDARYRHVEREFLDPFQVEREEQAFGTLVGGGGTITTRSATLNLQTGLNDPIGYSLNLSKNDKVYANVVNPSLFDTRSEGYTGSVIFRPSGITQVTLNAGQTFFNADDNVKTDRVTTDLSVALQEDVNPSLRVNAQIGYTDVRTDRLGFVTNKSGATGSISATQQVTNGDYSGSLAVTRNQNGGRTTLTLGRNLQLPNGTLGASVGVTKGDTGTTGTIARLSYTQQLKTSNYGISLDRTVTTNSQDQDVLDTRIAVNYGYEIDNLSRLDVTFDFGRSEDGGVGSVPTIQRANLKASYTRALTSDWNLQGGFLLRHIDDSSASNSAQSNSIFLTIDRNFSFRP